MVKEMNTAYPELSNMALENDVEDRQYTAGQIVGIWAAAVLPVIILTRVLMSRLISYLKFPPVILYWIMIIIGLAWLLAISLWILYREAGTVSLSALQQHLWLGTPRDPRTGEPRRQLFWRIIPNLLAMLIILGLATLILPVFPFIVRLLGMPSLPAYFNAPSYTFLTELASPEFSGQWWLIILALITWLLSAFLGEELLFRGILLPRMNQVFGKWDWVTNAFFASFYYIYQPWMVPFQLIVSLFIAWPTKRFRSFWMAPAIRNIEGMGLLLIVFLGVKSYQLKPISEPVIFPNLEGDSIPLSWSGSTIPEIPKFDPHLTEPMQVDLRGLNLSNLDLGNNSDDLFYSDFDSRTIWPQEDRMPPDFSPARIMEIGKNPGLGVRQLHSQGLTGRGVGIAIIDQALLISHQEYAERLRWYEKIGLSDRPTASMHGPAVASIAVGRTIGVAPEADLYYIGVGDNPFMYVHYYAQGIRRILEINEQLPEDRKIRVISISMGWLPNMPGYYDISAAAKEAREKGMLIICSSSEEIHGFSFIGLGRSPLSDPDDFESYEPGLFWASRFYENNVESKAFFSNLLYIPMDSRTTASPTGNEEYVFYRSGGLSWSIPYIAGMYALAVQTNPSITPDEFWSLALATGRSVNVIHEEKKYILGPIADPNAIIAALKNR